MAATSGDVAMIQTVISSLATAVRSLMPAPTQPLKVYLDLDEPLNHGYDAFIGNSSSSCPLATLAMYDSSLLDTYQATWESSRGSPRLPDIEFVMGGDEAPAAVYNAPTFRSGDTGCPTRDGDMACYIDLFYADAKNQPHLTLQDQWNYKFLFLDIGTPSNDWLEAVKQVIMQAQGAMTGAPLTGEIFAVINDGKYTNSSCFVPSYWQSVMDGGNGKNDFCPSDMAAIAAAQLKTQEFLTLALEMQAKGNSYLIPQILRVSSYDKPSPSHLIPDKNSASLTSMINWLFTPPAQGKPGETLFKLYDVIKNGYQFTTDLTAIETQIESPNWQAQYPVGTVSQQQMISTLYGGITLQPLYRYTCNINTAAQSDYLTLDANFSLPPPDSCSGGVIIDNAASYENDQCVLFDAVSPLNAVKYPDACPNAADIPVWRYKRRVNGLTQYYQTINQQDTVVLNGNNGWAPDMTGNTFIPAFMSQPVLPRYQPNEPVGFQSGLLTAGDNTGNSPTLNFFGLGSTYAMTFGFQTHMGQIGYVLALDGPAGFDTLICGNLPGNGNNCPMFGNGAGVSCMPDVQLGRPALSCGSQLQNGGLTQYLWGDSGNAGSCCEASMGSTVANQPSQDPVTNIFPQAPYIRVYSNDNSCTTPNSDFPVRRRIRRHSFLLVMTQGRMPFFPHWKGECTMKTTLLVLMVLTAAPIAFAAPTVQVVFNLKRSIGENPEAGLLERGNYFIGAFLAGGKGGCADPFNHGITCGTVTRFAPPDAHSATWRAKLLYRFQPIGDGSYPQDMPIPYDHGNLILTTSGSGQYASTGALVELFPPSSAGGTWTEKVLYQFGSKNDIYFPIGAPHADSNGNIFVSAQYGGAYKWGGIAELSPPQSGQGAWTETIIHEFDGQDGGYPNGGMLSDANGNLFITTNAGNNFAGSVVELSPPTGGGTAWTETILHSFAVNGIDGLGPSNGLVADANGNYYGSTDAGGPANAGTVYELSPPTGGGTQWTEQVLYSFTGGADGGTPSVGLARDAAGNIFATTLFGGIAACQCGTLVELAPPQSGQGLYTETTLHQFTGPPDGNGPVAITVEDNGNLLVPTYFGGQYNDGALVEVTNSGFVTRK